MRSFLIGALWLLSTFGAAIAQSYSPGEHAIESHLGEIRVNSGFVSNLNAHVFHVYTFLFMPSGEGTWHQLPVVRDTSDPALEFVLTRTATADFTTRDARIFSDAEGFTLAIAQLQYEETPYDDDAHVSVETFRLRKLEEEGRWIFEKASSMTAPPGRSVEDALSSAAGRGGHTSAGAIP